MTRISTPRRRFNFANDDLETPDTPPVAPEYDNSLSDLPIDEAHFLDANFRAWILGENGLDHISTDDGDFFTGEQRWNVTVIDCCGQGIRSLAGIEYFPNLEWLFCGRVLTEYVPEYAFMRYVSNPIVSLDVSCNPKLTLLYANYCKLESIDLSQNPALTHLNLFYNELTELDLSNNPLLEVLAFDVNNISAFDPSILPNLRILHCGFTTLTALDLSGRTELTELRCHNNDKLETLNINDCANLISTESSIHDCYALRELRMRNSKLSEIPINIDNLQILDCGNNAQYTSLNLSDYRHLRELYCDNCNLYRLDLSMNREITILNCSQNHLKQLNFTLLPGSEEYGGEFYGHDQSAVCASGMEPEGDVFTFDMANLVSSDHLDRILGVDGAAYDPDTGIATFAEAADTIVYTYRTQPESATFPLELTVTVTLNVEMPDLPEGAIPIDAGHFPDANFRAWILKSLTPYYTEDAFGRQYLTDTRYDAIYFGMDGWGVASLEGLQYFPNAFSLMCGEGHRQDDDGDWIWHAGALTEVDFSQNPNLVEVYLNGNQLEEIDVSCLPILQWLGVKDNRLTTIDVSTNYNLAALYCGGNNLTSIALPGQTVSIYPLMRSEQQEGRLTRLECDCNALTELDLSMQTELKEISCENNDLTTLNLSENEHIGLLDCDDDVAITLPEGMSICAQMTINEGEKTYQCTPLAAAVDKITGKDGVTDPGEVQSAYITVLEDMTGPALEFAEDQQKTVVIDLNGHTNTAESEPALITYENDVTVINGEIVVNPTPTPEFRTQALALEGRIGLIFYLDLSGLSADEKEASYMTFAITGADPVSADPVPFDANNTNGAGTYYDFTCYVASIQMADTITATFHYGDGLTVEKDYSIAEYIESFEESVENGVYNEDDDEELIALVHALADYGHYMQLYLADAKDLPLGAGEDAYMPMDTFYNDDYDPDDVADCLTEDFTIDVSCSDTNIKSLNYTVAFESETTLRLIFKPASGFTGDLYVDAGNGDTAVPLKSKRWTVEIPNIRRICSEKRMISRHGPITPGPPA